MRAHPRSRGENRLRLQPDALRAGSSPLTRGKRLGVPGRAAAARLIPAHAGKTNPNTRKKRICRAHPRSRGENGYLSVFRVTGLGSSPLTRGKPGLTYIGAHVRGLIPAHAGKTSRAVRWQTSRTAHPRSRGENSRLVAADLICRGSSPLTRGKPHHQGHDRQAPGLIPAHAGKTGRDADATPVGGLIPAHAGKTAPQPQPSSAQSAHPRSRGENATVWSASSGYMGSSPLTRGKRAVLRLHAVRVRLIPAHAGKTRQASGRRVLGWAHPRSRGENTVGVADTCLTAGSSPLTRGKPAVAGCTSRADRLIPAHAGKTSVFLSGYRRKPAHPRSRGENCVQVRPWDHCVGSSPLTRGKPDISRPGVAAARLIPAHAGKTASP